MRQDGLAGTLFPGRDPGTHVRFTADEYAELAAAALTRPAAGPL